MTKKKPDPITIERCRDYLSRCKDAGKKSVEITIIDFLISEIEKLKFNEKGATRDLTYESGERWLERWMDVPLERWPHAVKLLYTYSQAVKAYKGQREEYLDELKGLQRHAHAFKELVKISLDQFKERKDPI